MSSVPGMSEMLGDASWYAREDEYHTRVFLRGQVAIPYRQGMIARIQPGKRTSPTDWVEERTI